MLAVDAAFLLMVYVLSRRTGWTLLHTFSLAAGGRWPTVCMLFSKSHLTAASYLARVGNVIFLAIARRADCGRSKAHGSDGRRASKGRLAAQTASRSRCKSSADEAERYTLLRDDIFNN